MERWFNIHSMEYYFQWQLSQYSDSLEAGLYVVCFLPEARDLLSIQNIWPALGPISPPFQWMLQILPHRWSSSCMMLITNFYFLLRLQISAVVSVLPLNVFIVYAGISLPFTILLEEWLHYLHGCNSVLQKMSAIWSHGTVCHPTVLCCDRTQNVIWWSVLNMEASKPLFMLVFLLCNDHLLPLSLIFSFALAIWPLLFGLMICTLSRCVS